LSPVMGIVTLLFFYVIFTTLNIQEIGEISVISYAGEPFFLFLSMARYEKRNITILWKYNSTFLERIEMIDKTTWCH